MQTKGHVHSSYDGVVQIDYYNDWVSYWVFGVYILIPSMGSDWRLVNNV